MTKLRLKFLYKLLLLVLLPLVATQFVTLFAISQTAESEVAASARKQISVSAQVLSEYLTNRDAQIRRNLEVLVSDFALKAVFATEDPASIQSALDNHSNRVGAAFALYKPLNEGQSISYMGAELDTRLLYSDTSVDADSVVLPALINGATSVQLYAAAVRAPTTIGYVIFGYALSDKLLNTLHELTGMEVSFQSTANSSNAEGQFAVINSTLQRTNQIAHTEQFGPEHSAAVSVHQGWLSTSQPIHATDRSILVTLQLSLADAMAPYEEAKNALTVVSFAVTLLAALVGVWFSNSVLAPLKKLVSLSQRMSQGQYDSPIPTVSNDELGDLATSFNELQTAVQEREARILHRSRFDPLTNLPNYHHSLSLLNEELLLAAQSKQSVCVAQVRMERLRELQSSFGQDTAEGIVVAVADLLSKSANQNNAWAAHTGTDQFTIVFRQSDSSRVKQHTTQLHRLLAQGVQIHSVPGEARMQCPITIGLASYPHDAQDAKTLLRLANIACQDAISAHRQTNEYTQGREEEFAKRVQIVNDLPQALRESQLFNVYQPKVTLKTGETNTVEALVRWIHPELGFLNPDEFITAAEDSGSITQLTYHVLREALADLQSWQLHGHHIDVAVNLSTKDLLDEGFCANVHDILQETGVAPGRLVLEVTESSMMEQPAQANASLSHLRKLGIKIAMDDFGTGHSSLAQLKEMPIDQLKIDRAFVQTIEEDAINQQIVANTIELAHSLNLEVVAEGVEEEFAMYRLTELGCEFAQGYFISKPLNQDDLLAWLNEFTPTTYNERRKSGRPFTHTIEQNPATTSSPDSTIHRVSGN